MTYPSLVTHRDIFVIFLQLLGITCIDLNVVNMKNELFLFLLHVTQILSGYDIPNHIKT